MRPVPGRARARPRLRTGDLVRYLGDVRYVGVDVSEAYIESARRLHGDRAEFRLGDATRLDKDLRGFDLVLAFGVVHHLDDAGARRLFAGAARALAPSGRIVAVDPAFAEGQPGAARCGDIARPRQQRPHRRGLRAPCRGRPPRRDGADPERPAAHPVHALRARGNGAMTDRAGTVRPLRSRWPAGRGRGPAPTLAEPARLGRRLVLQRVCLVAQAPLRRLRLELLLGPVSGDPLDRGLRAAFGTDGGDVVSAGPAGGRGRHGSLPLRAAVHSASISLATTILLYLDPFFSRMLLWDYAGFAAVSAGVAGFALWWWSDGRRLVWTLLPGAALAIASSPTR